MSEIMRRLAETINALEQGTISRTLAASDLRKLYARLETLARNSDIAEGL